MRALRVLLISHWFPPANVIGSIRVGYFAKRLHLAGHHVRVLAAQPTVDDCIPVEIPTHNITYVETTPTEKEHSSARREKGIRGSQFLPKNVIIGSLRGILDQLRRHYYAVIQIPDARASWLSNVSRTGYAIVGHWPPDIIIASAPPVSGLVAAYRLAKACGAPWVADLRDLWAENPYYEYPRWRLLLDRLIEKRVLSSAAGLVTVSERWAETLRRHYRCPIACVPNGFVEEHLPVGIGGPPPGNVVSIVYTGSIYPGYRDPTPLFRAIALLQQQERERVEVHFYVPSSVEAELVRTSAAAERVLDSVFVHKSVSYQTALSLQFSADVLLLLQWNNEKDAGNVPAKFFEYVATGRPILLIGYEHGNLADLLRERLVGCVANDPPLIAFKLRQWLAQRSTGIPAVNSAARSGLSRADQYHKFEQFLGQVVCELRSNGMHH